MRQFDAVFFLVLVVLLCVQLPVPHHMDGSMFMLYAHMYVTLRLDSQGIFWLLIPSVCLHTYSITLQINDIYTILIMMWCHIEMKSLGIISVGFDATDQLLIRSFAFVRYWRKKGNTMRVHQLFVDFKKAYDSVRLIKMCLNETCSKVHIGIHLSDNCPIQNGLKQGAALSQLLFNLALGYANRKVQENPGNRN
jgi:hypothetical protein